jgi:hypothetical protein
VAEVRGLCGSGENMEGSYSFHGSPGFVLACKLRALKTDLKKM